jgi:hypothetical protein
MDGPVRNCGDYGGIATSFAESCRPSAERKAIKTGQVSYPHLIVRPMVMFQWGRGVALLKLKRIRPAVLAWRPA